MNPCGGGMDLFDYAVAPFALVALGGGFIAQWFVDRQIFRGYHPGWYLEKCRVWPTLWRVATSLCCSAY